MGFGVLFAATLVAVFFYLSEAVDLTRHDTLYATLLAAIWSLYFSYDKLLRIRVLGPLLVRTGRLLLLACAAGFFGGIYWLIFRNG